MSADPRDGLDSIELRGMPGLRGFTHLELRARADLVDIHELGLRLPSGRIEWLGVRAQIAPGELRTIALPYEAGRAEAIVVDYGDPAHRRRDRTPARLELYGALLDGRGADRGDDRGAERAPHRRVIRYWGNREPRSSWRDAHPVSTPHPAPPFVRAR